MKLRFHLSGSVLFETEADCAPPVGSVFLIRTTNYKSGLLPGALISVPVGSDSPPLYDYSERGKVTVTIDCNGYTELEEGTTDDH